jgi:hypothetical protein
MYGMVNKAIEELVTRGFGAATWGRVCARAGVEDPVFIGNEAYPDDLTYRLVGAASEETGLPVEEVLHRFGVHWILETAREGYGDLLDATGESLPEFLENLPAFHTRVTLMFPELRPPEFSVSEMSEGSARLHYRSHREGLQPFVVGLLDGLGRRFGVEVRVEHDVRRADGADHDVFHVTWSELATARE